MSRLVGGVVMLSAVGAFGLTRAAPSATAQAPAAGGGGASASSSMERLRPLWAARGLMDAPAAHARTAVRAGTLLAWAYEAPTALVALDVRTGRERWRMSMPREHRPEIALAGDLALVHRSIGVTAVELATGQQRWTGRLCHFHSDLETLADLRIGVGLCPVPDPPGDSDWHPRQIMAFAVDLATGRELWRRPSASVGQALVAAAGVVYLSDAGTPYPNKVKDKGVTIFALDPRSGKVRRSFPLLHVPGHIQLFPGDPTRALFLGGDIAAVSLTDGRVSWRQPAPLPLTSGILPFPRTELRDGRLVVAYETQIRELDLRSGATLASWDIPWAAAAAGHAIRQTVRAAPGGGALLIKDWSNKPALAFQFGKPGTVAKPVVMAVGHDSVLAVEDGVVVVGNRDGAVGVIEGYAAFETIAPEATALDPAARVRAILGRHARLFGRSAAGVPEHTAALADLRAVPGFEAPLAALAGDVASPWHNAAVDAVATTGIPGAAPILLAEVMRPLGFPPLTGDPKQDGQITRRFDSNAVLRRGVLIVALADLGDAKIADALAPLLFDAQSPTGYGRRDWETWGAWVESGYGRKRWAATEGSPDAAFSPCLQAPAGRPEPHAAIYRLLARLARPRDIAALRRFDADNDAAGGWSHLCDRDDAIKTRYVDRGLRSNGLGLCQGWDAGAYRVTQAEALWLRRRPADGSLGPPAWGADPGGDTHLERRPVDGVQLDSDGHVEIRGNALVDYKDQSWSRALDPAVVFADRDRDGLTDLTEAAFGTDPDRPDTDGDGTPDGRDPAPFARPAKTDAARVHDELVRFLTTFRAGGPVTVYADPASWGGGGGVANAGIVLHRPLAPPTPSCPSYEFCQGRHRKTPVAEGSRRCETVLAIEDIKVHGRRAEATVAWPAQNGNRHRIEHKLELRKVDGVWRVTADRGPMF